MQITAKNDPLWMSDQQLGPAYAIDVSKQTVGARVSFPVDPAKLQALIRADGGSANNLYVQIYEPVLGSWMPLKSSYNQAEHTESAVVPHLSTVSLGFTDQAADPSANQPADVLVAAQFQKDFAGAIKGGPTTQQDDACPGIGDRTVSVTLGLSTMSGCVTRGPTAIALRIQSTLPIPMDVTGPPDSPPDLSSQPIADDTLSQFADRTLAWSESRTLVPAHGFASTSLQKDALTRPLYGIQAEPDLLMYDFNVILALIAAFPGGKTWTDTVLKGRSQIVRYLENEQDGKPGTVNASDVLAEFQRIAVPLSDIGLTAPDENSFGGLLDSSFECLKSTASTQQEIIGESFPNGLSDAVLADLMQLAVTCLQGAISQDGQTLGETTAYTGGIIGSSEELLSTFRQATNFSPLPPNVLAGDGQVRRSGTSATSFVSPSGNIACSDYPSLDGLAVSSPPTETACEIFQYQFNVPDTPCADEPGVFIEQTPADSAYITGCAGDAGNAFPKSFFQFNNSTKPPLAATTTDGDVIDLKYSTCTVLAVHVECIDNARLGGFDLNKSAFSRVLAIDTAPEAPVFTAYPTHAAGVNTAGSGGFSVAALDRRGGPVKITWSQLPGSPIATKCADTTQVGVFDADSAPTSVVTCVLASVSTTGSDGPITFTATGATGLTTTQTIQIEGVDHVAVQVLPTVGTANTIFRATISGACADGAYSDGIDVVSDATGLNIVSPYLVLQGQDAKHLNVIAFKVSPFDGSRVESGRLRFDIRCHSLTAVATSAFTVTPTALVVLGDSYSSGEGSDFFAQDTQFRPGGASATGCHRSPTGWAYTLAKQEGFVAPVNPYAEPSTWTFAACSGAEMSDITSENDNYQSDGEVEPAQIGAVSPTTDLVLMTIGGNDVGFQSILQACIVGPIGTALLPGCSKATTRPGSTYVVTNNNLNALRGQLSSLYVQIASRLTAGGQLVVGGYPQFFGTNHSYYHEHTALGGDYCRVAEGVLPYFIEYDDAQWINGLAVRGNEIIASEVDTANSELRAAGMDATVLFVGNEANGTGGVDNEFSGHRQCDSGHAWINPLKIDASHGGPFQTSFHPSTDGGQQAYARAFEKTLGLPTS